MADKIELSQENIILNFTVLLFYCIFIKINEPA